MRLLVLALKRAGFWLLLAASYLLLILACRGAMCLGDTGAALGSKAPHRGSVSREHRVALGSYAWQREVCLGDTGDSFGELGLTKG